MSAREDLLRAAQDLTESGRSLFTPIELIEQVRRNDGNYPDSTLRTHTVSWMCANAPANEATGVGEFVRVGRGLYRINDSISRKTPSSTSTAPTRSTSPAPRAEPLAPGSRTTPPEDWYWEGHVQSLVVSHLARTGWSIRRVADTESSEHGHDISADRAGERLLVEVKGYPTSTYARGERRGQTRNAGSLGAQARTYFSNALLSGCVMRSEDRNARIALAFPAKETFSALAQRVGSVLLDAGIEVWLVEEDGTVEESVGRA
jgi:hypothetical protein